MFLFINDAALSMFRLFFSNKFENNHNGNYRKWYWPFECYSCKISGACCWSFKIDKWILAEPSLPLGMFLVSPPALCPNLEPQLLWARGGIVVTAGCLEQEFLPAAGGPWHPEPLEMECVCWLLDGKGEHRKKRTTCGLDFWGSSAFVVNGKHVSSCHL